jgi:hypothetical protein
MGEYDESPEFMAKQLDDYIKEILSTSSVAVVAQRLNILPPLSKLPHDISRAKKITSSKQ